MNKNLITPLFITASLFAVSSTLNAQTIVYSQGFNSGFVDPYNQPGSGNLNSFGIEFGNTGPGIVIGDGSSSGTVATEGDSFAGANNNRSQTDGTPNVVGAMVILDVYTVQEVGEVLTFSGDFGWRFGSASRANDLSIQGSTSGFLIGAGSETIVSDSSPDMTIGSVSENAFQTHNISYTTTLADVGQTVGFRLRLVDADNVSGITQLLTDNWQISSTAVIPEPSSYALIAGMVVLALVGRRRKIAS